jgi:hypothetical protein
MTTYVQPSTPELRVQELSQVGLVGGKPLPRFSGKRVRSAKVLLESSRAIDQTRGVTLTDLIDDDMPGALSVHPDLPPLTVAQLEWYHRRYLERGDTATALVLACLAASDAASKLWKEMRRRRDGEYMHPAGLVSVWRDGPDLEPQMRKLHSDYLKKHPNGAKWRDVRKWLDSAAHHELWERQRIVAELLAMLAERVTRSDAGAIAEIARRVQTQRDTEIISTESGPELRIS